MQASTPHLATGSETPNCVAVTELNLSYYTGETLVIIIHTYYDNCI